MVVLVGFILALKIWIGTNMRAFFEESGLSELTGIGRGTINSIANNRMKKIPAKAICNICVILKCNVGEIWYA